MNKTGHYLRPNEANRYPRRIICLDSEARIRPQLRGERHSFKLAVATYDNLENESAMECEHFHNATDLWQWVESKTGKRKRVVLWAHNLGYDLRITQALIVLPMLGWHLQALSFGYRSCWAKWSKESRHLTMVDFISFIPRSLDRIATEIGMQKNPLPGDDAPEVEWLERCKQDALILRAAVMQTLNWLEESDMGSFRMTGAAQSTAAFRHKFLQRRTLLVHNNADALEAERKAAWTGRCEVWKHGKTSEALYEWDYQLAYATIAQNAELPVALVTDRHSLTEMQWRGLRSMYRILSEVKVETKAPVVPTDNGDRIFWPTGRFKSVLWDEEIELALAEKSKVEIGRSWLYRKRPLLSEWATWIIESLEGENPITDPLARILVKSWSRQLIGRFGLRYPKWNQFGTSPVSDLFYMPFLDVNTRERGVMFQVGNDLLEQAALFDAAEAAPAIMSSIMASARIRLWNTMRAIGLRHIYYVDTDSIILDYSGTRRLQRLHKKFPGLRLKGQHIGGEFKAPRSIQLGEETRIAGLPKISTRAGGTFLGLVWQSMTQSLTERHGDSVDIRYLNFDLKGEDYRREHIEGGETRAYAIG